jgi:hypothetical protein
MGGLKVLPLRLVPGKLGIGLSIVGNGKQGLREWSLAAGSSAAGPYEALYGSRSA